MTQRVDGIHKEVGVFEIEKDKQVDDDTGNQQKLAGAGTLRLPHSASEEESQQRNEDEDDNERTGSFIIEKETDKEKIRITEKGFIF